MRLNEVLTALHNADAAGDVEAARRLAQLAKDFMQEETPEEIPTPKAEPKHGFVPALESSYESLKGGLGALAGKLGITDPQQAEAYFRAQQEKAKQIHQPTEESWTQAPLTKFGELVGGSLPYMVAPAVAGVGAAIAAPELAIAGIGAGTLGAFGAGTGQFTATNLARQLEEGKSLKEASLGTAAAVAPFQAALDTFGLRMIPGVKGLFGEAGIALTNAEAKKIAEQGLTRTLGDYALTGGKVAGAEGLTEAGQQVFERLQAGLSLTDPEARQEYLDNFLGGAVLGGVLSVPGRAVERGRAKAQAKLAGAEEEQPIPPAPPAEPQLALPAPEQLLALPAPTGPAPAPLPTGITETNVAPPARLANEPAPNAQRLVDEHDAMQRQARQLETQINDAVKARDTGAIAQLTDQHKKLQDRIGALSSTIQQMGGVTQPQGEFETQAAADLKNKQSKIASTEKKLDTAQSVGDFEAVAKHAAALEQHKKELADLEKEHARQRAAYEEQQANVQQRGQTRELFTREEAPIPPIKQEVAPEEPGMAKTPKEALSYSLADVTKRQAEVNRRIQEAEKKLDRANKELPALVKGGDQLAINAKTDEINKTEAEIKRLLASNKPNRQITDIFSTTNKMRNAINEGNMQEVLNLSVPYREEQRVKRETEKDKAAADKEALIKSLDERLNLAGTKLTRTADEDTYDSVTNQIQGLMRHVLNRQKNNKFSYYQQLEMMANEYDDLEKRLETGIARPNMREKAAALQAKLGKGEAPAERQMDASEKFQVKRKMQTLQRRYDALVAKEIAPTRKKIEELHRSLYEVKPAAKASDIKAEQRAEELRRSKERTKTGKVPVSRAAATAKRINAGDVNKEAEQTTALKDLAKQKGMESPEYQAMIDDQVKRLDNLRKKHGANDKAVNDYRIAIGNERVEKALELGKKTPEYKQALAEQVKKLQEALATTGTQQVPSKRTPQETRNASGAPGQFRTSSAESKTETAQRTQRYNRLKGIQRDFEEGIQSEKEGERLARGVETQTPDLTETQVKHLENNDIQAALTDLANAKGTSKIAKVVAARLAALLDNTDVKLVNSMTDKNGNEVLGSAISTKVTLNRNGGLSEEILLHEGTHAGAERVIVQYEKDPSKLTEMQRVAVKELMLLHNVVKNDPRFTSVNAKSSLSEFVAEVMSNRNLQEQLKGKRWKLQDAWNGFKSIILRMLGFDAEAQTMLGAALQSVDALFIPSSTKLGGKEKAVNQRLSAKDIAALHTGSNSMKQFADQFGGDIKQKDRTPEDANRIGRDYLDEMYANPEEYIQTPYSSKELLKRYNQDKAFLSKEQRAAVEEYYRVKNEPVFDEDKVNKAVLALDSLKYNTIMSDGKEYDPDNPLHYVEAEAATFANLKAQKDSLLRDREGRQIARERTEGLKDLVKNMMDHGGYTFVEQALVAKAAAKYAILSGKDGRLKLATIESSNRHTVAVVGVDDAHAVIEELRAGKPLKEAFLTGMQKVADKNAKNNQRKEGWQKFDQSDEYDAAVALNAGAANTPWCTGAGVSTAQNQITNGDFYIYYSNGRPEVAVRMDGKNRIGEIRGNSPNQALNNDQQKTAKDFLAKNTFANTDKYIEEFDRKQFLIDVFKGEKELAPHVLFGMGDYLKRDAADELIVSREKINNMLSFRTVDGYSGRPEPSKNVTDTVENLLQKATETAFDLNYFPGQDASFYTATAEEITFAGKNYFIDPKTVKGLNELTVGSSFKDAHFPELQILNKIDLFGGNITLPNLNRYLKKVAFYRGDAKLYVPVGTTIEDVRPSSSNSKVGGIIYGAQTVKNVVLNFDQGVLQLKLPDALYVSLKENNPAEMGRSFSQGMRMMFRGRLSNKGIDTAIMQSALPEGLKDKAFSKEVNAFMAEITKVFGKNVAFAADRSLTDDSRFSDWLDTVGRVLYEEQVSTPESLLKVNEKTNKEFFSDTENTHRRLFTEYGKVDAPNKIADSPPVQAMTEEPEEERYAPKAQAPGFEKVLATADKVIASPKSIRQRVEANLGLAFRTQVLDRFAPLEKIAGEMKDAFKGMQMMYYLRMYDQRMSFTQQAVGMGVPQRVAYTRKDGRTEYVIESVPGANLARVVSILKEAPNMNAEAANRLFSLYLLGKRAERVGYAKLNYKVKEADLRDAVKQIEGNQKLHSVFTQARNEYNKYNKDLMKFLADTGALSPDEAKALADSNDYIPYYRERNGNAELMIGAENPIKVGNLREQPYLHELIGGEEKILDFLTSSVQNTSMLVDMGLRNLATKNAMYELIGMKLAHTVAKSTSGPDIVRFRDKGEDKFVVVDTKTLGIPADLLVKGLEGIPLNNSAVVKAMSLPATFLRKAVTLSPIYAFRQLVRDSVAAPLLSGADFTPVMGAIKELGKSATKEKLERRGITGGQIFTGTNEDLSKILRDIQAGRADWTQLISKAEGLTMEADAATRRAQYNSYIAQGLSEMEATLMSLEAMNFNRRGVSPSVGLASKLIPFFNAQLQSLDVLYRAFTGKMPMNERLQIQNKLFQRGALLALTAVAYTLLMQDDDTYKNANPDEKYGNFFVHIPGISEAVRVPVPFEIGYIFKGIPEALINSMRSSEGGEDAYKAFKTIAIQTIPGGSSMFLPEAIKPFIENVANYSFYTGRSLESLKEQNLQASQRYRDNTSEVAKGLGKAFDVSPIKIENLVRGYTGSMGVALLQALNVAAPASDTPEQAVKRLSDTAVIGSLFQPADAGGRISAVYDHMHELTQVQNTFKDLLQEGKRSEANAYLQDHINELASASVVGNVTKQLATITQAENAIKASTMTPQEKRAKLDEMRQLKIKIANTMRGVFDRTEHPTDRS